MQHESEVTGQNFVRRLILSDSQEAEKQETFLPSICDVPFVQRKIAYLLHCVCVYYSTNLFDVQYTRLTQL